jgi:hypothetical protein
MVWREAKSFICSKMHLAVACNIVPLCFQSISHIFITISNFIFWLHICIEIKKRWGSENNERSRFLDTRFSEYGKRKADVAKR